MIGLDLAALDAALPHHPQVLEYPQEGAPGMRAGKRRRRGTLEAYDAEGVDVMWESSFCAGAVIRAR
eukprot:1128002-Pelagomonas_calceolata.AAC.7